MPDAPRPGPPPRVPPNNLQAEESVLGAMMLSREAIADVVEILEPDHFYKPAHAHLFDAILSLYSGGEPVDAVTVADELNRASLLDEVGGPAVPSRPAGHHAGDQQRLALREDRRGARPPAADDRRQQRDRRNRLRHPGRCRQGGRRRRGPHVRRRPAACRQHDGADQRPPPGEPRSHRDALRPAAKRSRGSARATSISTRSSPGSSRARSTSSVPGRRWGRRRSLSDSPPTRR